MTGMIARRIMQIMFRRPFTVLLIFAIVAFGYRPSTAGMMPAAEPAVSEMAEHAVMPDCLGAMADGDCCDRSDGQKNCALDAACVARCHVNVCAELVIYMPSVALKAAEALVVGKPQTPMPERPGTLFRPPII